jgi:PEGA domain-containing protein
MFATNVRVLLIVLAVPAAAGLHAQQRQPHPAPLPPAVPPPVMLPYPPLMPQPAGGLPFGVPFTPPPDAMAPRDLFRVQPNDRVFTRTHIPPFRTFGGGAYLPGIPQIEPATPELAPPGYAYATGLLRLVVTPADAQVFVDSYYVGTVRDLDLQRALPLPAGSHRVEIRAPDYEPIVVDVRIVPHETVTYRAALEPTRPPAAAPAPARATPASGPTKMYVIPNCYAGNVPPRANRLPRGCDVKDVQVL